MIIDFHTHIFPEKIAKASIDALESRAGIRAFTDGTLQGLKKSMETGQIDYSVILPVVTRPTQFKTVNEYAAQINRDEKNLISFGGIHPDSENYKEELKEIKNLGLKGIKLHPDYQNKNFDDLSYMHIVDYASELGLIISVHAGVDIGLPNPVHCAPARSLEVIRQIHPPKLVLAHMGGWKQLTQVEELLVGEQVYLDTSFTLPWLENETQKEQFIRIIRNHGADKILFATDSPWSGQKEDAKLLNQLGFTQEEMDQIMWKNAEKLLF